jgi:uncharacterized protein YkwD
MGLAALHHALVKTMGRVKIQRSAWLPTLLAALLALPLVLVSPPLSASATITRGSFENCLLASVNAERTGRGMAPVEMADDMVDAVRDWSEWMRFNDFEHMPGSLRRSILPDTWTTYGENIAWNSNSNLADCSTIHEMWMNSSGHRANILNPSFHFLAVGAYVDGSGWWATQLFFDATNYPVTCEGTFCDDDGTTFEPAIEKVAAAGFTQGCNPPTNDRYCPDDLVTRGEMATFLTRAFGL